jgi:transketolase
VKIYEEGSEFKIGKANLLRDGRDLTVIASGYLVAEALKAAGELAQAGISADVLNFHTIKPFDNEAALKSAQKTGHVITIEEHTIIGGLGSAAAEALAGCPGVKAFKRLGINDKFGHSGKPGELFKEYGLTADNIVNEAKTMLK